MNYELDTICHRLDKVGNTTFIQYQILLEAQLCSNLNEFMQ